MLTARPRKRRPPSRESEIRSTINVGIESTDRVGAITRFSLKGMGRGEWLAAVTIEDGGVGGGGDVREKRNRREHGVLRCIHSYRNVWQFFFKKST